MTQCPALVYENTEVVIVQTDAKTFADMFQYPICNLCVVSLLYFIVYQRLTKFMTSTSLSAINAENQQIVKQAPNFTPKSVKLGAFVLFKIYT